MFGIFNRRKSKQSVMQPIWQRCTASIDKRQQIWAAFLNHKAEKYSKRSKQICLALFCLLAGGGSIYIAIRAIKNPTAKMRIEKTSVPGYATENDTINSFQPSAVLTEEQYHNIQRFKKYTDSLQTTKAGKVKYDSILKARPGLTDSIDIIEQVYHLQVKQNRLWKND